jgi:heptosyltransferase-2/heptosyltransferase-3
VVGFHPGASWPAKRWPAERFAAVADQCADLPGVRVILTAGPKDEETIAAVERSSRHLHPVLSGLPLRDLAAVIAGCDVYVSNDAGPMHIAAAVGTPTIGIFGPGEEKIWFPYAPEDGHTLLRKEVPCHPCRLDFCNREGEGFMECMMLLGVGEVCSAIERILRESGISAR